MRITTLLQTASLLSSALAAPPVTTNIALLNTRDVAYVPKNQSKCKGWNNVQLDWDQSVYEVYIGRPYLGGKNCDLVQSKIESTGFQVEAMRCSGVQKNGNTKITILSNMKKKNLALANEAMRAAYPEIRFSCPTDMEIGS
ncbi:Hypothetical predicted protein [Lecanosticta acicola]|uniref:Uncharacterized protein n=1 Tax=Lecanosticta acicola TaxID=111012 RepID=A0AAI8W2E9_9PEZI|nr:Hypothetical predicted protein [Lecanosticta acicola]